MPHTGPISSTAAVVMAITPERRLGNVPVPDSLRGVWKGVEYHVWKTSLGGPTPWSITLPRHFRVNKPGNHGPGYGGSYASKAAALLAIADGKAEKFAREHAA